MSTYDPLAGLVEAARLTPDNLPLRKHLAESFAGLGRFEEAEAEYRAALARNPQDVPLKLALARIYLRQDKTGPANVIAEDVVRRPDAPGEAHVLLAKLLHRAGEIEKAVGHYRIGVESDPEAADAELADRLGIGRSPVESEVSEGRLAAGDFDGPSDVSNRLEKPKIRFKDVGGMEKIKEHPVSLVPTPLHPSQESIF